MKILLVVPTLGDGGAERVVSLLSKGIEQLGCEVGVIIFSGPVFYHIENKLIDLNVTYSAKTPFQLITYFIKCIYRLKKQIKAQKPDIIISFTEIANICSLMAQKGCVISVRAPLQNQSNIMNFITRNIYRRARKIIACSNGVARELLTRQHLKRVVKIYNPLDLELINKQKEFPIQIEGDFLLAVGRLSIEKNHSFLISAYADLVFNFSMSNIPSLVIIGDGPLKFELRMKIKQLNLHEKVHLLGRSDNPYSYMSRCKIFILPSLYEGFPNVLIEAMACQSIVVASDCPSGPGEIIQDGENGFLMPLLSSARDLSNKIFDILEMDFESVLKIKYRAKKRAEKFSILDICKEYLNHVV